LKDVEDEVVVRDHTADVVEGVSHSLYLVTVVTHREVTLDEVAERGVEVKCVHFAVVDEQVLEHEPNLVCGDTAHLGDILKLAGYRVEDLGDGH
jgi:hypothetical protein